MIYRTHTGCPVANRREFLHLGVAALSLPIAARAGVSRELFASSDEPEAQPLPLYEVYFDERFAACTAFAEEIKRRGLVTQGIRGDITDIWFKDLYYQWKQGPAAIAGMTAPGAIFCLEMLARDARMRVALRVDHRIEGQMEHEYSGPEKLLMRVQDSAASAQQWPVSMAELVAQFPAERGAATAARFTSQAYGSGENTEHLVTWVIAPHAARRIQGDTA